MYNDILAEIEERNPSEGKRDLGNQVLATALADYIADVYHDDVNSQAIGLACLADALASAALRRRAA